MITVFEIVIIMIITLKESNLKTKTHLQVSNLKCVCKFVCKYVKHIANSKLLQTKKCVRTVAAATTTTTTAWD